jgi:hypothetical protein
MARLAAELSASLPSFIRRLKIFKFLCAMMSRTKAVFFYRGCAVTTANRGLPGATCLAVAAWICGCGCSTPVSSSGPPKIMATTPPSLPVTTSRQPESVVTAPPSVAPAPAAPSTASPPTNRKCEGASSQYVCGYSSAKTPIEPRVATLRELGRCSRTDYPHVSGRARSREALRECALSSEPAIRAAAAEALVSAELLSADAARLIPSPRGLNRGFRRLFGSSAHSSIGYHCRLGETDSAGGLMLFCSRTGHCQSDGYQPVTKVKIRIAAPGRWKLIKVDKGHVDTGLCGCRR